MRREIITLVLWLILCIAAIYMTVNLYIERQQEELRNIEDGKNFTMPVPKEEVK